MSKIFIGILICLVSSNIHASDLVSFRITDEKEIVDAIAINKADKDIRTQIVTCMGEDSQNLAKFYNCECELYDQIYQFNELIVKALDNHPSWKDAVIFYTKDGQSGGFSMFAHQRWLKHVEDLTCRDK
jgi:hypothetical protein